MEIKTFFDNISCTFTYLLFDSQAKEAIIIDPVLINNLPQLQVTKFIDKESLSLKYIFETHIHADHLSAAFKLRDKYPNAKVCIHEDIKIVIDNFRNLATAPAKFDIKFKEDDLFNFGKLELKVLHTPGHTPTCSSFLVAGNLFVGDTIFMPDFGTGRCDFPSGSAKTLYQSINKIFKQSDETVIHVGHDYAPNGREYKSTTSVKESKERNIHLNAQTSAREFIDFRNKRDKTLAPPKILDQAIKYNLTGLNK